MSQQELADQIGVHVSAVVSWENGKHEPTRYLGKIEQVLGISIEGDTAEQTPELVRNNFDNEIVRRIWAEKDVPSDDRLNVIAWWVSLLGRANLSA